MIRVYILPIIGSGFPVGDPPVSDPRRPKYVSALPVSWAMMDFGSEPLAIVVADVDDATHTALAANADVNAIPPLTQTVGGALATVQSRLEAVNLPAGWVTSGMTYGQVLRVLASIFLFLQRYGARFANARLFIAGAGLNTTFSQLPLGVRQNLTATAASFDYVTTGITGASTIRQILKAIADQRQGPIRIGPVTL